MRETPPASETGSAIAFDGPRCLIEGPIAAVQAKVLALRDEGRLDILVFDADTGRVVDLPVPAPRRRAPVERAGPGRPKLGVVAREVTLLPRHWDWLNDQPGGASVTLRKLVDQARQAGVGAERVRKAREAAYRFMTAIAGDRPGYEEAIRALFSGEATKFAKHTERWPADIKRQARTMFERTLP